MPSFYTFFRGYMKFVLKLFYRKIRVEGLDNVPLDVPLLVVPNHQNALLDPLLVGSFIPRPLHYLTRSDVFSKRTKPLLALLNMIPIYRIRDGFKKLALNDAVFEECRSIFLEGGSVLIFPEGNHGKEYFLRPLTKGAARLAIQAYTAGAKDIMVQPVGLNFWDHQKSRSVVLVKFGRPFAVKDFADEYEASNAKGLKEIRNRMSSAMKETLLLPDENQDYPLLKKSIFCKSTENLSFEELRGIKELHSPPSQKRYRWLSRILNPLPFFFMKRLLKRTEDVVFHGTIKIVFTILVFPLWWVVVFGVLTLILGWKLSLFTVLIMISGLFYDYRNG